MLINEIDFRLGRYQDVLQDVTCDTIICDPPYGKRTHEGQRTDDTNDDSNRRELSYKHWDLAEIYDFTDFWHGRCSGWFCIMTSHDLASSWESAMQNVNLYVFAPIPCVMPGMTCRLAGDGPSSWTVWLIVGRPKHLPYSKWGTLPGAYESTPDRNGHIGGKPLRLMNSIIRDYSKPNDLICDPCAGGATTLIAAASQGRRAIGSEMDVETYRKAKQRIDAGYTKDMFIHA